MHPSREELSGYALGTLPEPSAQQIEQHVAECPACEETLAQLEAGGDTVMEKLRHGPADDPLQQEAGCREMLAVIEAIGREPSFSTAAAVASATADLGSIGVYKLLAKLGEGGMGTVYKALHTKLDRVVALKILPTTRLGDERAVVRFQREMKAVGQLAHPNIVMAHDAGEADGTHFLVMEYVDGLDLSTLVARLGPLPVPDACEIIRQAAVGLQYAHEHGLVHRDIKPANLMLSVAGSRQGSGVRVQGSGVSKSGPATPTLTPDSCPLTPSVKILDLGLALFKEQPTPDGETTASGQAMGTADYMAPEQTFDSHAVDIRADIYSLGCTLYKLLSGHAPFSGPDYTNQMAKMMAHVQETPQPIAERRPEVPAELAALVERMMAKRPEDRFDTPADVAAALASLSLGEEGRGEGVTAGTDLAKLAAEAIKAAPPTEEREASHGSTTSMRREAALVGTDPLVQPRPAPQPTVTHQPAPRTASPRRHPPRWTIAAAMAPLFLFALGVVIWINRTRIEVPDGSEVRINQHGGVQVTTPGRNQPTLEDSATNLTRQTPKSGNYALELDGSDSYVEVPGLRFKALPLTIEANVSFYSAVVTQDATEPEKNERIALGLADDNSSLVVATRHQNNVFWRYLGSGTGRMAGAWKKDVPLYEQSIAEKRIHHLAICSSGNFLYTVFIDGKKGATYRVSTPGHNWRLLLGSDASRKGPWHGTIDEVRVSSVARYDEDFEPPRTDERFQRDEHTLALYHLDEGQGNLVHDSSGNGHHGRIVGANWIRHDRTRPASNAISPSHSRVELLTLVDPAKDAVEGKWHRDSSSLGVDAGNEQALLQLPVAPAGGYSLDVRLRRVSHGEDDHVLGLSVAVGEASAVVVLDQKGNFAGLSRVDGRTLAEGNGTGVSQDRFEDGTTHAVNTTVRPKEEQFEIIVHMDGERLFDWKGSPEALSLPADWKAPNPRAIGLLARGCAVEFDSIRFTAHEPHHGYAELLRPHLDKALAMQNAALVPRPAPLPGVLCWTIESREPGARLMDLATSPTARMLALGSYAPHAKVHIVDASSGQMIQHLSTQKNQGVQSLHWSADGSQLAVMCDYSGEVWDVAAWARKYTFPPGLGANNALAWSPSSDSLAMAHSSGRDKTIHIYDTTTAEHRKIDAGAGIAALAWPHAGELVALTFPPDSQGMIRFLNSQTGEVMREVGPAAGSDIAVSPDGSTVTDGNAVWVIESGAHVGDLACGGGHRIAWSPNGNIVASLKPTSNPDRIGTVYADGATGGMIGWGGYAGCDNYIVGTWLDNRHVAVGSGNTPPDRAGRIHVYDLDGFVTSAIQLLPGGRIAVVTLYGHWRGSDGAERHLQYAVLTESGEQLTLTPAEFTARYGWKNDPEKVRLVPAATGEGD